MTGFQAPAPNGEIALEPSSGRSADLLRTLVTLARQAPRDDSAVIKRLLQTLQDYPALADKSIYRMKFKDKRSRSGFNIVSGTSIRAAETIAAEMGFVWTEAAIQDETADYVDIIATAFDAQRANVQRKPFRVSRLEKADDGRMTLLNDRRMLMAIQSGVSKAARNAILAVVPYRIRATYEHRCRELLAGGDLATLADAGRVKSCIEAFDATWKVSVTQLETYVGRPRQSWVGGDLADLRALFVALEDGETTLQDAFPVEVTLVVPPAPSGPVTVEAKEAQLGKEPPPPPTPKPPTPPPTPKPPAPPPPVRRPPRAARPHKPEPPPEPAPVLEPYRVEPEPPLSPTLSTEAEPTLAERVARETSIEALDALLGRTYLDKDLTREAKYAALALISARRHELQSTT
jgi:hypothetical protein